MHLDHSSRWLLLPPAFFLLILTIPHTVTLRLLALFISCVIAVALWRKYAPPAIPCKGPILLWAAVALASLVTAIDPLYSAGEIKNEVGYTLAAFIAFYAMTREERTLRWFLGAIALTFTVLSIGALVSWSKVGYWLEGKYFGGSASYSTFVTTTAPLLVLFWSVRRPWKLSVVVILASLFALAVTGAYLTWQRATLPILLVQLTVALFLLRRRGLLGIPRVAILTIAFIGLLLTIAASQTISHARFQGGFVDLGIRDVRLEKLEPVVSRIIDAPLTGHGFGRRAMIKAHPELARDQPIFWHAHNVFLNYGLQLGLPGILVLVALFSCLFWKFLQLYRYPDPLVSVIGMAGMLMIFGVLARNQTNDMFVRDLSLLFWSLCGMLLGFGLRRVAARNKA